MLHTYLQELLKMEVLEQNPGLLELLQKFLGETSYEKERKESSNVAKAVGSVKTSVKNMSSAVTSVPGNILNRMEEGFSRVLQVSVKLSWFTLCMSLRILNPARVVCA
jgi:hypothetical protein